ncbi:hypothetical protein CEXT_811701 [Caerostris extrusa]|uniref:Uncharacterized protein n=1 Tax=Caerostris extrusa TaxID=172846 RepID=A0AAV4TXW5_CAEEX|nr:hypothetical protein CEXT_811701 [Caerostris extrusa]
MPTSYELQLHYGVIVTRRITDSVNLLRVQRDLFWDKKPSQYVLQVQLMGKKLRRKSDIKKPSCRQNQYGVFLFKVTSSRYSEKIYKY